MSRSIAISALLLTASLAAASTRPQYGGTLRVETRGDADAVARPLVFDTLTHMSRGVSALPALATRWDSQNQAQRWQFWLRAGVRFHDGTELTAEDVVRSLNDACVPACPWRTLRSVGSSIVFTTDTPAPVFPEELARPIYAVTHKTAEGELDGTGAFRISSRGRDSLALEAVNDCWAGGPFLDAIEIDGRRDPRTELLDLSVGRADLIDIPPELVRQAAQSHLAVVTSRPVDLVALLVHSTALSTAQARQAIAEAVDRSTLWSVIFQKQGEPSASLLPNDLSGYGFLFPTVRNLSRATELASAVRSQLTVASDSADPQLQLVAERLALNLHEAGLNVLVRPAHSANPDLTLRRIHLDAGSQRGALHQMLAQVGKDADDGAGDPAALYRLEHAFLEDHTVVPLVWLPRVYGIGGRVRGLELAPDGTPLLADVSLRVEP